MSTQDIKIRNDLIEAYKGYYEDDEGKRFWTNNGNEKPVYRDDLYEEWVKLKILSDTPAERLKVYCEWNGILGYSNTLFDIATGGL